MSSALRFLTPSKSPLFYLSIIVLLVTIGLYSARYLPAAPGLFITVFLARTMVALCAATGIAIFGLIFLKIFKNIEIQYRFSTVLAVTGAVVAVVMAIVSLTNNVSEGLLLLY